MQHAQTFIDTKGRRWDMAMSIPAVKRVRQLVDFDLMLIGNADRDALGRLSTDPILLVDVIYAVCKQQADEAKVTDEEFGSAMGGDALDAATGLLLKGVIDLFPGPRRDALRAVVAKLAEAEALASRTAITRIEAIDLADLATNQPAAAAPAV